MRPFLRMLLVSLLWVGGTALAKPNNDELKIAVTQEFENLNPLIMQMYTTSYIYKMVGRCLNVLDPDGKVVEARGGLRGGEVGGAAQRRRGRRRGVC